MPQDIGLSIQALKPLTREMFESAGVPVTEKAVPVVSVERPNTRSWNEWVTLINGAWRKAPEAYINTGKQLLAAKEELPRDEFESIIKLKLAFEASVARKLICIGANPIICAHVHKLPPCWSTIYELTKLDYAVLQVAFENAAIHPKMKRKDVRVLAGKPPHQPRGASKPPVAVNEEAVTEWLQQATPEAKQRIRKQLFVDISDQELRESLLPPVCAALVEHCIGQEIAAADVLAVLNAADTSCRGPRKFNLAVTLTRLWRVAPADELNKIPVLAAIERKLSKNGRDRRDTVIALVSDTIKAKRGKKRT
jgi:hypothetical protein